MITLTHIFNPRQTWPKTGQLRYGRIMSGTFQAMLLAVDSLFRKRS